MSATWVTDALGDFDDPAGRLVELSGEERTVDGTTIGVATLRFEAEDLRGERYRASARIYLPERLREASSGGPLPVWFNCGYELQDPAAVAQVREGRIVVTPCDPAPGEVHAHTNPLGRGPNTDIVLAHLVRALPIVDPTAVIYTGGSAGGYAALMVAAEAFPALAVVVNSPVLNLPYQTAYFTDLVPRVLADPPADQPLLPLLLGAMDEILQGSRTAYGDDIASPSWWWHSPLAHLERLTCPAAVLVSTADFLVPIVQVGRELAAATLADLPGDVRMAPDDLTDVPTAHRDLLGLLGERAAVQVVPVPEGARLVQLADLDLTLSTPATLVALREWPDDRSAQWSVTVVDEGPTVFGATHGRHQLQPDFESLVASRLASPARVGVDQLSPAKLDQLLDRHRGVEWMAPGFVHLDQPAAERADVERSLQVYLSCGQDHARRFVELYDAVAPERRTLPDPLVAEARTLAG